MKYIVVQENVSMFAKKHQHLLTNSQVPQIKRTSINQGWIANFKQSWCPPGWYYEHGARTDGGGGHFPRLQDCNRASARPVQTILDLFSTVQWKVYFSKLMTTDDKKGWPKSVSQSVTNGRYRLDIIELPWQLCQILTTLLGVIQTASVPRLIFYWIAF